MNLKENKFVKAYLKNEKSIFEGIFVSLIAALAFTAIFTQSFKELTNINFVKDTSLSKVLALFIFFVIVTGVVYVLNKMTAKIAMFVAIIAYFLLAAYASSNMDMTTVTANPIGQICFLALSGVLAVIAFLYVKDDVFKLQSSIKISDKSLIIFTAFSGVLILVFTSVLSLYRFESYSSSTFDYGIFAQGYEYLKQTGEFKTVVERGHELTHFAVHFSPILYIALPIYFIFPKPETISVIQAIMVALPVLPIFLLGKHFKLSNKVTMVIMAIYALLPATIGGVLYDFHENCFLTFMILMLVWAVEKKKNILMVVFLLLTLFVKEDAAAYVMILGAFWIFSRKDRARGALCIVAGAVYFFIAVKIVNSFGYGVLDDRFLNLFYDKQGGLAQIIRVFITNPGYVLSQMTANADNMDKLGYIIEMFVPIGVLAFAVGKKYSRYILLGSIAVMSLATTYTYLHDIGFQYNFGHIALIFYLIILNIADMKPKKARKLAVCSFIICLIMFTGLILPKVNYYNGIYKSKIKSIEKIEKAISMVPNDKSVFTSGWVMPHMANNIQCYDISYLDENHKEGVPEYPDYLLVDEHDSGAITKFAPYINTGKYVPIYDGDVQSNDSKIVTLYKLNK